MEVRQRVQAIRYQGVDTDHSFSMVEVARYEYYVYDGENAKLHPDGPVLEVCCDMRSILNVSLAPKTTAGGKAVAHLTMKSTSHATDSHRGLPFQLSWRLIQSPIFVRMTA